LPDCVPPVVPPPVVSSAVIRWLVVFPVVEVA
jgi:hypothetical protein